MLACLARIWRSVSVLGKLILPSNPLFHYELRMLTPSGACRSVVKEGFGGRATSDFLRFRTLFSHTFF